MKYLKELYNEVCSKLILEILLVIIFIIPLIVTMGQYIDTGYIFENCDFNILFWPGSKTKLALNLKVYVTMGLMGLSYVIGIIYLCRKRTFVKASILVIAGQIFFNMIGSIINRFIGYKDLQNINSMNCEGIVNKLIFSLWQNPIWEECFFTGIPLILFYIISKNKSDRIKKICKIVYYILPSIVMALYHVPNHGVSRVFDTFFSHILFEYIALKYSFFAPVVLHYIFDAMMVTSLSHVNSIPKEEIIWIVNNKGLINTSLSICELMFIVTILFLIISYIIKNRKINSYYSIIEKKE